MKQQTFETQIGGKTLSATFTDLAEQANGSVLMRLGETALLITAVMSDKQTSMPYFPLSVEFEEKFYAAGAILGNQFQRREGRPSEDAILSARIIDRSIRPLFDQRMRYEIQVIATVLAMGEDDPDVLGVIGASLALAVSDIPWNGPLSAVRIAKRKSSGELVINPTYHERDGGALAYEVLACGKDATINMIETAAFEVGEGDIISALEKAVAVHTELAAWQHTVVSAVGKAKRVFEAAPIPEAVTQLFADEFRTTLYTALFSGRAGKSHLHEVKDAFIARGSETIENFDAKQAEGYFETMLDELLHEGVLKDGKRADGRGMDEVRSLFAQAGGVSPVLHGSGIFYRGGTHIFSALTLGGPGAAQTIDTIEERDGKKSFMHHYNFPPFSVGEAGRVGGFNRRMIGHGALAEKALIPVIPAQKDFPYTIRLVSETLASNGSSSMGSVCGSTLALMDGGVPITRPVAGIASGVMMGGGTHAVLTDIQGPEDEHGDMDFKVAGTREGVTAIQMDVKVDGVPITILAEALEKAKQARFTILDVIEAEIAAPRPSISPRAPEIVSLMINPDQIGLVIGGGGKTINAIKDETGVEEISIEDDGSVYITGRNGTAQAAKRRIENLTKVYALGERVTVTVTKIADFGAFAKLPNGSEGLIHVSELVAFRVEKVGDILTVGETIETVVVKIENGKIGLSLKQADPDFAARKGLTPRTT